MARMTAVNLGWDIGRPGGDKTVYYCSKHGHLDNPCACIDAYFKSQVKAARVNQIREQADDGSFKLSREFHSRNPVRR